MLSDVLLNVISNTMCVIPICCVSCRSFCFHVSLKAGIRVYQQAQNNTPCPQSVRGYGILNVLLLKCRFQLCMVRADC